MPVEIAEIAAGLPVAASFAMATGVSVLRDGRRRASQNQALHELRRPLQALTLALPEDCSAGGSLRMAAAAADRLDREINGGGEKLREVRVRLRPIVESALERWRPRAGREGRRLTLRWRAADVYLLGDELGLVQAVDNLINNALEHGGSEVRVEVRGRPDLVRLSVRDRGGPAAAARQGTLGSRLSGRARHGHGLRIVRRVAARHGGSFRLLRSPGETEARLELPLAEGGR
ncbi:MAG TPA: ATP-binding protein [Solirubrobacterales bacterium]|nr:ATP-binding protein [Solirubrobacterales bacterium]